ncbi:MAG TPA: hypothetical protein VN814_22325 [Caulobacteraceae bacterium]|nr:hypothetical protein [Caulobacteraceae bacterium]
MLARSALIALSLTALDVSRATAAPDAALAPCQRLAAAARGLAQDVWSDGFAALKPQLTLAKWDDKLSPLEARLAALPAVKAALGDEDGGYKIFVQPLAPGLFVASDTQGTLDCQGFVFLRVGPGGEAKIVPGPPAFTDQCWTDAGQAGRVFGQPAFVETSDFADPAADTQQAAITPWTGEGWGLPCRLTLTYRIAFAMTERFCGDFAVCAAATPLAADIAAVHGKTSADAPFTYGAAPSGDELALLERFGGAKPDEMTTPPFSTFGVKAKTAFDTYSYNDVDLFPLRLDGVSYVAAVGYGGVGWRMIGDTLIAVYSADDDKLKPLAGFVVVKSVTGLASAEVDRPKPVER